MGKHLIAGLAALVLMTGPGLAIAQTYPPAPPPVQGVTPPPQTGSSTSTTTGPYGDYQTSTTQTSTTKHGVDINGNPVTEHDTYKAGVAGSKQTHTTVETDPWTGATTTHTTTTNTRQ